jgi:hypothetical protein
LSPCSRDRLGLSDSVDGNLFGRACTMVLFNTEAPYWASPAHLALPKDCPRTPLFTKPDIRGRTETVWDTALS